MQIDPKYQDKLSRQAYTKQDKIDGVEVKELQLHTDDGGNFLEIFRVTDNQVEGLQTPFEARQISLSVMLGGVIKAYHVHKLQDDLWFVPPNHRLLINLHDVRQDSPTFDQHMRFVLGGGKSQLVRIPSGVAHGVKNAYSKPMFLFYATSQQFNAQDPDEHRLPWDVFGSDVWELVKG